MARKNGLNRQEQVLCAKWLKEGIAPKDVAKKLKTSTEVVKKFTQEKIDSARKKADDRAMKQNKVTQQRKKKAAVVKEALKDDTDFE